VLLAAPFGVSDKSAFIRHGMPVMPLAVKEKAGKRPALMLPSLPLLHNGIM